MRQIGSFRPLRRDCARLAYRRMSWIVSKGRAAVFLSYIAAEKSVNITVKSEKKSWHKLFLIMRVRVIRQIFPLQCMIQKPRPDLLTLSTTFYDLSVSCNIFSKAEMRQFGASGTQGLTYTRRVKGVQAVAFVLRTGA